MEIPLYIVDAFSNKIFAGNPAAICPLEEWLDDDLMQSIAAENNLSETAFFVPDGETYSLRWFTPTVEVDLCGHATLASAFVLSLVSPRADKHYRFQSKSGELRVTNTAPWFYLDFPTRSLSSPENQNDLISRVEKACACRPVQVTQAGATCIAEFDSEKQVKAIDPDLSQILALEFKGLIITARGDNSDFVSRFFAPKAGINEDPVTGSIHCGLIPYWHNKLGKREMLAYQVSTRGGELRCRFLDDRVEIGGQAVLFSQGKIFL